MPLLEVGNPCCGIPGWKWKAEPLKRSRQLCQLPIPMILKKNLYHLKILSLLHCLHCQSKKNEDKSLYFPFLPLPLYAILVINHSLHFAPHNFLFCPVQQESRGDRNQNKEKINKKKNPCKTLLQFPP